MLTVDDWVAHQRHLARWEDGQADPIDPEPIEVDFQPPRRGALVNGVPVVFAAD